jgi:hypothetical protein
MEREKQIKILLNAEPFGFGPTAAIAAFFPYLKESGVYLGFAGKGHTLDLQRSLGYDQIHNLDDFSSQNEEGGIRKIISEYDAVLTALDFSFARIAKEEGKFVGIYDPLTWYWKDIPQVVRDCDVYFAQNFIGVSKRIENDKDFFQKTVIVPPIIQVCEDNLPKNKVLLNLGGLQNPFWNLETTTSYASIIIQSVKDLLPNENLIITTSSKIAENLRDLSVQTFTKEELSKIMEISKYALMTPGLGNIFDAACHNLPTLWLPPANDSQGQQLRLLTKENVVDEYVAWNNPKINYFGDQQTVLSEISRQVQDLRSNGDSFIHFKKNLVSGLQRLKTQKSSKIKDLLNQYGHGGDKIVAEEFLKRIEKQ